ncbi:MAG: DNA polymerase Y family protein [Nocardioides sp.]|uniref:Y-family DNA polymerase n=1 Tax=Nocardioides sp. TaxID=35761 RepID=UPI0039E241CB
MRIMVVWCADWSVAAALAAAGLPRHLPAAVFGGAGGTNLVHACNEAARSFGIRRRMRRRDAQSRCPELVVLRADEAGEARAFEEVLTALEQIRPGVRPLRPGLVALRSPARYYGGEAEAAAVLAECVVEVGVWDVRIGVADELFTAEQAARQARVQDSRIVPAGESADFLRGLPVEVIAEEETVGLLRRLGLPRLGDLADLPPTDIRARFGAQAAWVREVIAGAGRRPLTGRTPPPELACEIGFEPPLTSAETVCFSSRRTAELFIAGLDRRRLVATEVIIEVETERGGGAGSAAASIRRWLHPRWFTSTDLIDRLHWQIGGQTDGRPGGRRRAGEIASAITRVRFVPGEVVPESVHADGLWGGTDARVERGVARVQGMLGPDAVVAPMLQGGRSPGDRQAVRSWGALRPGGPGEGGLRDPALPWPGSIPPPAPARVLAEPWPAEVADASGRPVVVRVRGGVSGEPSRFRTAPGERWQPVAAWAGPWPVTEQWWEPGGGRRIARFQLVGVDGRAWLLRYDCDGPGGPAWATEAAYD